MIGSFWNLCRACPSMPVDKLHSEYRSTYRWHEYTGSRQEVVRQPPQSNNAVPPTGERADERIARANEGEECPSEMPKLEPALPRRKKHPELAYRHHEFLSSSRDKADLADDTFYNDRARSEERGGSRWRPSRRSKSEGPARGDAALHCDRRRDSDPDTDTARQGGLLRKAISKISTEYRLQFAWPHGHLSRRDELDSVIPRKSLSMGAIKPAANAALHKKRSGLENKDATSTELEPLVADSSRNEEPRHDKCEPSEGRFTQRAAPQSYAKITEILPDNVKNANGDDSWYREVVELRKKAGQYKHRGWVTELAPDTLSEFYNKQIELWDQVSRRSSLSALSLASTTHRSYTKEEKEQENNKRSSPTKNLRNTDNSIKTVRDIIRHHLERTTGGSELDGLILSPTREKLEPAVPRNDDFRNSQKSSPQKYNPQKGSPQKMILQKRNSQKVKNNVKGLRSQSVGPVNVDSTIDKRSPKRQSRSATVKEKRTASNCAPRRPRPSTDSSLPKNERHVDEAIEAPLVSEPPSDVDDSKPVVKSPPEPTRVKSPEQILMRSPDPVNWTVPLDTGKTFTVTQNIKEGDILVRPHSEVKAWTPPEIPPPIAQSAPPQFTEQTKERTASTS